MGLLAKLGLGGAAKAVEQIGGVVDKLHTSAGERNESKAAALQTVLETQCRIIEAEAKTGGLASLWRPIASLFFVVLIGWIVVSSTFGYPVPEMDKVPAELWAFLMGYGGVRSAEKVLPMFLSRKERKAGVGQ